MAEHIGDRYRLGSYTLATRLGKSSDTEIGWAASVVLGLSVWLTYVADRLFDVGRGKR